MQNTELFQWVKLSQDVPGTSFKQGDEGVVVECLEANENTQESGYLLEMFQDGETVDVIAVPTAWTKKIKQTSNPITISSEILQGTPVFSDTEVPIQTLWDYLKAGDSIDDFLKSFPSVKKEQVIQFLDHIASFVG